MPIIITLLDTFIPINFLLKVKGKLGVIFVIIYIYIYIETQMESRRRSQASKSQFPAYVSRRILRKRLM